MKLIEDNEVILGSAGNTSKFKIAASAKAFKILSSGLYKNKIRAIVRELTCNVVDAHKLNGTTDAFEIKAPTQLDPRFVIRDFGPGLDEEDITNLYSTYFASTKSNSNDFIGALGLGSKSPFSYTDTFTVVSYNGGMVRGFTAMLDGGEPTLRKVFEEPMKEDEKTGIEITVPVKMPDIAHWQHEIRYVLRTFGEWPHVLKGCATPTYFPPREGKTKDWFTINSDEGSGLYAVYGNIVYPLSGVRGLNRPWMSISNYAVYIHFELGELDIAASREELSLDEETTANIIARVDSLSKIEMASEIKRLQTITNERELLRELDSMHREAVQCIEKSGAQIGGGLTVNQLKTKYKAPESLVDVGVVYDISIDTRLKRIKDGSSWGGYGRSSGYNIEQLFGYKNKSVNILIDDKSSKRVKVIRGLAMKEGKDILRGQIIVYKEDDEEQMAALETVKKLFADDKVNILRVSECDDIIKLLPESNDPKEARPASNNVHKYVLNSSKGYYEVENFRMTSDELKEIDGLVILRKRDDFHDFPSGDIIPGFGEIRGINQLAAKLKIKEFYVVRSTVFDRLVKYGQCDSLLNEITERVIKLIDSVDYDQYVGSPNYGSRVINVINREPKLNFVLDYLSESGKSSKEAQLLNSISSYIDDIRLKNHDISIAVDIITKLKAKANETSTDIIKKFEKEHPVVYYVLNNCYTVTDDMISDIKNILNNTGAHAAP